MVMRNERDEAGSNWWDDLPPGVKKRLLPPQLDETHETPQPAPAPYRPAVVADLSKLAALVFVVALADLMFLLFALWFLTDRGPFGG